MSDGVNGIIYVFLEKTVEGGQNISKNMKRISINLLEVIEI